MTLINTFLKKRRSEELKCGVLAMEHATEAQRGVEVVATV